MQESIHRVRWKQVEHRSKSGGMKDTYLYVEIALEKQILEFPKINARR